MNMKKTDLPRVNHNGIDDAHDEIIAKLENLESHSSRSTLLTLMIEVYKHATVHFLEEEQFMQDRKMPRAFVLEHRQEHKKLEQAIHKVIHEVEVYPSEEVRRQLLSFRTDILEHITKMDRRMIDYL
jgi:hemerythrin-like metal-binding protein